MIKPLVSILIPVYNREGLLGPCIQSALEQTFSDYEIVVVDNCSTDKTWDVCLQFADRDSRVRVFRNDENLGPVKNWQRCLQYANGKYGKILFSDDMISPLFLERTLPYLQHDTVGFVVTAACIGEQDWQGRDFFRLSEQPIRLASKDFIRQLLFASTLPLSPGCALFRVEDLRKNLMLTIPSPSILDFERHGAGPDVLLYLLTANDYREIALLPETLSFFRAHPDSFTIADKLGYLNKCYTQARVWFAENYGERNLYTRLYRRIWWKTCRKQKSIISPSAALAQYTTKRIGYCELF